jgi:hypothetical protein
MPDSWNQKIYDMQVYYNKYFAEDDLPGNYYRPVAEDGMDGPRMLFVKAVLKERSPNER